MPKRRACEVIGRSRSSKVNRFALVDEYLSYLSDQNHSPQTIRVYGFSLLAFCLW